MSIQKSEREAQRLRDSAYLACLSDFIRREYQLEACSITPAKRGYYGDIAIGHGEQPVFS